MANTISREAWRILHKDGELDPITGKPMANYYSCRLKEPNYDRYKYEKCAGKHDGKCIDHVYGFKGSKSELQALRYPKKEWTSSSAKSHCSSRGGKFDA